MNYRTSLIAGAVFGALGVAFGAFGAHALKPILEVQNRVETFELAVRYQFYHAFALIAAGLLMHSNQSMKLKTASLFFAAGILIFSGSLYVLSLSGLNKLGAITPIGGICLLTGWIVMVVQCVRLNRL